MRNLALEQILLLTLFILVPLINWLMRRVKRRVEDQLPREEHQEPVPRQTRVVPMPLLTAAASLERTHRAQTPMVSAAPSSRFSKTSLLGTRRDVRRASSL